MANIYSNFTTDDVYTGATAIVTLGIWSGDTGSLTTLYTSSTQTAASNDSFDYYVNVYQTTPTSDSAEVQFAISYGHISGGGAPTLLNSDTANQATKAEYMKYKNILLDPEDGKFTFDAVSGSTAAVDHIYIINMQRARLKERLDPGNWQLTLSASRGIFTFIDDSSQNTSDVSTYSVNGRAFRVISGSLGVGGTATTIGDSYTSVANGGQGFGLVYPERGIIVLNPNAIVPHLGFRGAVAGVGAASSSAENLYDVYGGQSFAPFTGSLVAATPKNQRNHMGLYAAISKGADFQARSSETISSVHYFVRLKNKEFNYSNNPSVRDRTTGAINITEFKKNPKVYATTIGLYNANNDLVAVAKLSRPIEKGPDREALIRVRLDF